VLGFKTVLEEASIGVTGSSIPRFSY